MHETNIMGYPKNIDFWKLKVIRPNVESKEFASKEKPKSPKKKVKNNEQIINLFSR